MTVDEALAHAASHLAIADQAKASPTLWRLFDEDPETGRYETCADVQFRAHAEAAWAWSVVAIDLHRAEVNEQWSRTHGGTWPPIAAYATWDF